MPNLAAQRPMLGAGLITAETADPQWRLAHELLMPAFTQAAMRRYHPLMVEVAGELIESWDRHVDGPPVDVVADTTKVTLEVIGRAGFSYSFDSFGTTRTHPFVLALKECMVHGQRSVTRAPVVGGLLGSRAAPRFEENLAYLNSLVDKVIDARGAEGGGDLLGLMLAAGTLDRANIRHQILTFLAAGHETTASAAAFALHYLATNPDVLAAAQAEADVIGEPTFEQVGKLRHVIDEAMRLWPPAPGYARQAVADTVLGGRYPLGAVEAVFVLLPALHRDPVWVPSPCASPPTASCPSGPGPGRLHPGTPGPLTFLCNLTRAFGVGTAWGSRLSWWPARSRPRSSRWRCWPRPAWPGGRIASSRASARPRRSTPAGRSRRTGRRTSW